MMSFLTTESDLFLLKNMAKIPWNYHVAVFAQMINCMYEQYKNYKMQ